jgi:hypothetical protein
MNETEANSEEKVLRIFRQLAAERAERLRGSTDNAAARDIIAAALKAGFGEKTARDIAFHLADWNSEAAFIVAMHLFPEQFTSEEIEDGVERFLVHAPNHVAAATKLGGYPIEDIFEVGALDAKVDDETT